MSLTVAIRLTPNHPEERMKQIVDKFGEALQKIHKVSCFWILEICLRWTRVDTGRLRSGWVPYLAANGFPWRRSFLPARKPEEGAMEQGFDAGHYTEGFLSLFVSNGVKYAGAVNDSKSGIFDVSGGHSFRPALYGDIQGASQFFGQEYAKRMGKALDNADKWFEVGMKNKGANFIDEIPNDFGPPEATS